MNFKQGFLNEFWGFAFRFMEFFLSDFQLIYWSILKITNLQKCLQNGSKSNRSGDMVTSLF